jgi:pimeloyl-ACP methyl ester carboxylesterase
LRRRYTAEMGTYVDVPGGRIYAVDEGSGSPIVLIHAAIVDLDAWDPVAASLVRRGFRVLRYDMRGFGRTETGDVEFSPRADLIAILDAFEVGRVAAIGNSRGGQTALEAAIEFPDRFAAVMTIGSSPGGFDGGATPEEETLFEIADRLEAAAVQDPDALADMMVSIWADGPGQPPTRVPAALRAEVWRKARREYEPGHVSGRILPLVPPGNDRLGELQCPVLALCGGLDISHEVKAVARVAGAAPHARGVIWPDVAHLAGMEQPDRLADLIVEFVAPIAPWR